MLPPIEDKIICTLDWTHIRNCYNTHHNIVILVSLYIKHVIENNNFLPKSNKLLITKNTIINKIVY